ncbi:tRNA (adenosine(37)-N6)-threonylcarbamoyltransferase complex dimerization subunit type 1 TsaB [Candidatus Babeliales bacterium]|nr:tRNA (adenosine(37)-N6)-threonylcarbamoyltransferase complex dimerization subunit type 1 TsaB [Candidatus Babeliales bacterium]
MTTRFICVQGSYKYLELGLFDQNLCINTFKEDNKRASSILVPKLNNLLNNNSLSLKDLNFIAIDQGPGAFTSLRVAITTVNAISFTKKIPLIGIDGLEGLVQEMTNYSTPIIIPLLNAYNKDVYYGIFQKEQNNLSSKEKGYQNIDSLLNKLKDMKADILFTGNGASLHLEKIKDFLGSHANFFEQDVVSTNQIAKIALEKWNSKKDLSNKLLPLYLKTQKFKTKYS